MSRVLVVIAQFILLFLILPSIACTQGTFTIRGKVTGEKRHKLWLTSFTLSKFYDTIIQIEPLNDTYIPNKQGSFTFSGKIGNSGPMQIGWLPEGETQIRFTDVFFLDSGLTDLVIDYNNRSLKLHPPITDSLNKEITKMNNILFSSGISKEQRYGILSEYCKKGINANIALWLIAKEYLVGGYNGNLRQLMQKVTNENEKTVTLQSYLTYLFKQEEKAPNDSIINLSEETQFPFGKLSFGDSLSKISKSSKFTLIEFWASWCAPCTAQIPTWISLDKATKDSNLLIVGIAWEQSANIKSFKAKLSKYRISWSHNFLDISGRESSKRLGIFSIPANILIDSKGNILGMNLSSKQIRKFIN